MGGLVLSLSASLGYDRFLMHYWRVKTAPFRTRTYEDAKKKAQDLLRLIQGKSKRKLCIRAKYFAKQKVFFDYFWQHLLQKPMAQRKSRLRFLPCAIELIEQSTFEPITKLNPNKQTETLLRFYGKTPFDQVFVVQIKQTNRESLQFMSVFGLSEILRWFLQLFLFEKYRDNLSSLRYFCSTMMINASLNLGINTALNSVGGVGNVGVL